MKCIYCAGPYSAPDVISVLDNIREGMRISTEVFLAGYAPFSPWLDLHYTLMIRAGEKLTIDDYYAYSIAWLKKSDAVLMTGNWKASKGSIAERDIAINLDLPIFYSLAELITEFPK